MTLVNCHSILPPDVSFLTREQPPVLRPFVVYQDSRLLPPISEWPPPVLLLVPPNSARRQTRSLVVSSHEPLFTQPLLTHSCVGHSRYPGTSVCTAFFSERSRSWPESSCSLVEPNCWLPLIFQCCSQPPSLCHGLSSATSLPTAWPPSVFPISR